MTHSASESGPSIMRPADVCAQLEIQPYVLKFWEGEFPQLGRRVGSKRQYDPQALEVAREICRMVQEESLTLAEARQFLEEKYPLPKAPVEEEAPPPPPPGIFRARVAEAERRIADLEAGLAQSQGKVAEREEQIRAIQSERAGLQDLLTQEEKRSARLESRLDHLQQQLDEARLGAASAAEAEKTAALAEHQAESLRQELENARREAVLIEPLQGRVAELEQTISRLREDLDLARSEATGRAMLAARVSQLESDLEEQIRRSEEALAGQKRHQEQSLAHQEALHRAGMEEQASRHQAEVQDLRQGIASRDEDLQLLQEMSSELAAERDAFKQNLAETQIVAGRLPAAEQLIAELEKEIQALHEKAEENDKTVIALRSQLAEAAAREAALRSLASAEVSAALKEVRELAFDAETLAAALDDGAPGEPASPDRAAPPPPDPGPSPGLFPEG